MISDQSARLRAARNSQAAQKAIGSDRITLQQAIAEGIPSPPVNLVIGKKWLIETTSLTDQGLIVSLERFEITSRQMDLPCFEVKSEVIARTKNDEDNLEGSPDLHRINTTILWADGKLHRPETLAPEDDWQAKGHKWPKGNIQLADSWTYATRTRSGELEFSLETDISVVGFEIFEGHDCLVYESALQSTMTRRGRPLITHYRHRVHLDYNLGLEVLWQSLDMDEDSELSARLVEFRFPGE